MEEKKWYVGYDRCTISGFSLLYSIPYLMNTYPWHKIKGPVDIKSTRPEMVALNKVKHLSVNKQLTIERECLHRLVNLERIFTDQFKESFDILLSQVVPYIDISRIVALSFNQLNSNINIDSFVRLVSSMSHLRSFGGSILLFKLVFYSYWPNIRQLQIVVHPLSATIAEKSLTDHEIDVFYRSFPRIESLTFHENVHLNPSRLLNNMTKTISNVAIQHPIGSTPTNIPEFITCDWLHQNTSLRNFFYSCNKLNVVSLWF